MYTFRVSYCELSRRPLLWSRLFWLVTVAASLYVLHTALTSFNQQLVRQISHSVSLELAHIVPKVTQSGRNLSTSALPQPGITHIDSIIALPQPPHISHIASSKDDNAPSSQPLYSQYNAKLFEHSQSCTPNYNIFYLKVHKTGSSTMSTLLDRLTLRHNLRMLTVNRTPYPYDKLTKYVMPSVRSDARPYNVYCEHIIFNETEVNHFMPSETAYVATLRYPLAQMRSAFVEFSMTKVLGLDKTGDMVREFFANYDELKDKKPFLRGIMSNSFGLAPYDMGNRSKVAVRLSYVDHKFDLILMVEYFKEGLVLLRRRLCWTMEDIIFTIQRYNSHHDERNETLPAELQSIHKEYNMPEYTFYNSFNDKLLNLISNAKELSQELIVFNQLLDKVSAFCQPIIQRLARSIVHENGTELVPGVFNLDKENRSISLDPAPFGKPFSVHSLDCAVMRMDTVILRNSIKILQNPELCTDPTVHRHYQENSMYMNIEYNARRKTAIINRNYCGEPHPVVKVPLSVLRQKKAYMGLARSSVVRV